jgi:DNA polymerase-3 subunit epsilon
MGRCLSPCLNDLDPNLYRARLDAALAPFTGATDGREALLAMVEEQMHEESGRRHYERAATLRRRRDRLAALLDRLGGDLHATHASPRLVLAPHPKATGSGGGRFDAFWIVGGRVVDWGPLHEADEVATRTALALGARPAAGPACVPPDAVHELRIVATWLEANPEAPVLALDPAPSERTLFDFCSNRVSLAA